MTRDNVGKLFDFEDDSIKPEAIHAGWQTGESTEVTCLACNLRNGFMQESRQKRLCPYELFRSVLYGKCKTEASRAIQNRAEKRAGEGLV